MEAPQMETAVMPLVEEPATAAPPKLEEQELDLLAFELWRRASCSERATDEEWSDLERAVGYHASCL
jgi:hypothetical protein